MTGKYNRKLKKRWKAPVTRTPFAAFGSSSGGKLRVIGKVAMVSLYIVAYGFLAGWLAVHAWAVGVETWYF